MRYQTLPGAVRLLAMVVLVAPLAACMNELPEPSVYYCSADNPTCPPGRVCRNGLCWLAQDGAVAEQGGGDLGDGGAKEAAAPAKCGNNIVEGNEECDGSNLNKKTCASLCYAGGSLKCTSCKFMVDLCTVPTTLITIKAKNRPFYMGSKETEVGRDKGEDRHQVTLTHDFKIFPTETTQAQLTQMLGYNPSFFKYKGGPADQVQWHEAAAYCNALSVVDGLESCYSADKILCPNSVEMSYCPNSGDEATCKKTRCALLKVNPKYNTASKTLYDCPGYRLPTDAEWEYAYRAGTTTSTYAGNLTMPGGKDPVADKIAWFYDNTNKASKHKPVARKKPNASCLFDMAGNVWEWTNDLIQISLGDQPVVDPLGPKSSHSWVVRGGSYYELARSIRAARRGSRYLMSSNGNTGFRCVRSVIP